MAPPLPKSVERTLLGQGSKHVLGLTPGSSQNAKVVKDLLTGLAERGLDLNIARLWVIDGSKALRLGIE